MLWLPVSAVSIYRLEENLQSPSSRPHQPQEVPVQLQTLGLAFLGVELGGETVATVDATGEFLAAVFAVEPFEGGVGIGSVVAVDEIVLLTLPEAVLQGGTCNKCGIVPAHVGDFEFLGEAEAFYLAGENAEAFGVPFFGEFKKELEPETDAEKGTVGGNPVPDQLVETGLLEFAHAIHDCTLAGEDERIGIGDLLRLSDEMGIGTAVHKGTLHTTEVPHPRVNDGNFGHRGC